MSKGFWIIIAAIVVIFGGILFLRGDKADAPSNGGAEPTSHIIGDNSKNVTLVEYGDFQCSVCAQFEPIVKAVAEKYSADIAFQFRHLPITQIHQNAFAAARAAEAAELQGKFWEMHDLLFANQAMWSQSSAVQTTFEQYAAQLGLNVEQFKTDFASAAVNDRINADIDEFEKTGQKVGTPTFFLNGQKIEARSLDEFSKLIDEAIAKQQSQE